MAATGLGGALALALALVSGCCLVPYHVQLFPRWNMTRPDGFTPVPPPSRPISTGISQSLIPLPWLSLAKLASQFEESGLLLPVLLIGFIIPVWPGQEPLEPDVPAILRIQQVGDVASHRKVRFDSCLLNKFPQLRGRVGSFVSVEHRPGDPMELPGLCGLIFGS